MYNKVKVKSLIIAKRICKAFIILFAAAYIINLFIAALLIFDYEKIPYWLMRIDFLKIILPSMIISNTLGIVIFTVANLIFDRRLELAFTKKEHIPSTDLIKIEKKPKNLNRPPNMSF